MSALRVAQKPYRSNVKGLGKELDGKLERIVARAARDGARAVTAGSRPPVAAFATEGESSDGVVRAAVLTPRAQFWVTMLDKGTLGQRQVPLKQPGRRESSWPVSRRSTRKATKQGAVTGRRGTGDYTAHRHPEALISGGISPQYFLIRGKRIAEEQLRAYLIGGL